MCKRIKELIEKSKYETGITPTSYRFTKEQLMRLIELVEEEQVMLCAKEYLHSRLIEKYIDDPKRVSQQLTEKE